VPDLLFHIVDDAILPGWLFRLNAGWYLAVLRL